MTREELIERICPTDNASECGSEEYNFCCADCQNVLECMLLEYEKQIRADFVSAVKGKMYEKVNFEQVDNFVETLRIMQSLIEIEKVE